MSRRKKVYPKIYLRHFGWGTLYNLNSTLLNMLYGDAVFLFVSDQPIGEEHSHRHHITATEAIRLLHGVGTGKTRGRPRGRRITRIDWPSSIPQSTLNMGAQHRNDKRYPDGLNTKSSYYALNPVMQEFQKRTFIPWLTLWADRNKNRKVVGQRGGKRTRQHSPELIAQENVREFVAFCRLVRPKNDWVNLMRRRCELWLEGCPAGQVRSLLNLSQNELKYLDGEIGQYVPLPTGNQNGLQALDTRKMKSGVASKIVRQHKHGYFSNQTLPNQGDKSHPEKGQKHNKGETLKRIPQSQENQ